MGCWIMMRRIGRSAHLRYTLKLFIEIIICVVVFWCLFQALSRWKVNVFIQVISQSTLCLWFFIPLYTGWSCWFCDQLSLFAEVFHELLQFKMGSRILTSLEVYSSALVTALVTFGVYLYPQSGADEVKWGVMATCECHLQWRWWSHTLGMPLTKLWTQTCVVYVLVWSELTWHLFCNLNVSVVICAIVTCVLTWVNLL